MKLQGIEKTTLLLVYNMVLIPTSFVTPSRKQKKTRPERISEKEVHGRYPRVVRTGRIPFLSEPYRETPLPPSVPLSLSSYTLFYYVWRRVRSLSLPSFPFLPLWPLNVPSRTFYPTNETQPYHSYARRGIMYHTGDPVWSQPSRISYTPPGGAHLLPA